ncbi:hypothetical protein FQN57_003194 [Myotisia sp. PD_48]|nr:hypothetical protein FQN57_003194 [Myotisia sp. PD_48]
MGPYPGVRVIDQNIHTNSRKLAEYLNFATTEELRNYITNGPASNIIAEFTKEHQAGFGTSKPPRGRGVHVRTQNILEDIHRPIFRMLDSYTTCSEIPPDPLKPCMVHIWAIKSIIKLDSRKFDINNPEDHFRVLNLLRFALRCAYPQQAGVVHRSEDALQPEFENQISSRGVVAGSLALKSKAKAKAADIANQSLIPIGILTRFQEYLQTAKMIPEIIASIPEFVCKADQIIAKSGEEELTAFANRQIREMLGQESDRMEWKDVHDLGLTVGQKRKVRRLLQRLGARKPIDRSQKSLEIVKVRRKKKGKKPKPSYAENARPDESAINEIDSGGIGPGTTVTWGTENENVLATHSSENIIKSYGSQHINIDPSLQILEIEDSRVEHEDAFLAGDMMNTAAFNMAPHAEPLVHTSGIGNSRGETTTIDDMFPFDLAQLIEPTVLLPGNNELEVENGDILIPDAIQDTAQHIEPPVQSQGIEGEIKSEIEQPLNTENTSPLDDQSEPPNELTRSTDPETEVEMNNGCETVIDNGCQTLKVEDDGGKRKRDEQDEQNVREWTPGEKRNKMN